jgi:hypothetical protein
LQETANTTCSINSGYIGGKTGSFYKRSGATSVQEVPAGQADLNLFPSPVRSGQMIQWNSSEMMSHLLIIDQMGKRIHLQYLSQNNGNFPPLNSGVYFIQLWNEKGFTTQKLVVE